MSTKTTQRVPTTAAAQHRRSVITALAVSLPVAFLAPAGASAAAPGIPSQQAATPAPSTPLDLGASDLRGRPFPHWEGLSSA